MLRGSALAKKVWRVLARVFPKCSMVAQAIAFNLFLAFFPTLLLAVAFASIWIRNKAALLETIHELTELMPPGSRAIVMDFLARRGPEAWKIALIGWGGMLLGGSQAMKLLMAGIHMIYGEQERPGFVHRQLRGLLLLLITMMPILVAGILGVFGRPLRYWLVKELGFGVFVHGLWLVSFPAAALVLAMLALTVIYWVARPREKSLRHVLPGAALATLLWWIADAVFGFYVRRVPYSFVYAGLAAVIGLLIWMELSAVIVFVGAAWNAESATTRVGAAGNSSRNETLAEEFERKVEVTRENG